MRNPEAQEENRRFPNINANRQIDDLGLGNIDSRASVSTVATTDTTQAVFGGAENERNTNGTFNLNKAMSNNDSVAAQGGDGYSEIMSLSHFETKKPALESQTAYESSLPTPSSVSEVKNINEESLEEAEKYELVRKEAQLEIKIAGVQRSTNLLKISSLFLTLGAVAFGVIIVVFRVL